MLNTDRPTLQIYHRVSSACRLAAQDRSRSGLERFGLAALGTFADRLAETLETPPPTSRCDRCGAVQQQPGARCTTCSGTTYLADPVAPEGSSLR